MAKRKGGRGHKAPYETVVIRCPRPISGVICTLIQIYSLSGFSDYPSFARHVENPDGIDPEVSSEVRNLFWLLYLLVEGSIWVLNVLDPPRPLPVNSPSAKGSEGQGSERSGDAKRLPFTLRFIRGIWLKGRGRGEVRSVASSIVTELTIATTL